MTKCILIDKNKKTYLWSGETFEIEIYDNSGILDKKIAGFIRYDIQDRVELVQIYIRPKQRKKGLGRLHIKELEKIAKKKKIIIHSGSVEGEPFHEFCKSMGFNLIAPRLWEK